MRFIIEHIITIFIAIFDLMTFDVMELMSTCTIALLMLYFTLYNYWILPNKLHNKALQLIEIDVSIGNSSLKMIMDGLQSNEKYELIGFNNVLNISNYINYIIWSRENKIREFRQYEIRFINIVNIYNKRNKEYLIKYIEDSINCGNSILEYINKNIVK